MQQYHRLVLTAIIASFLMLVILIALSLGRSEMGCAAVGGLMTILTVYLWRSDDLSRINA